MKREVGLIKEEVEEGKGLIKDIDEQRVVLRKVNF